MLRQTGQIVSLILWLAIFLSVSADADTVTNVSAWSFRPWQTEDGLPDNSVTGVAQTSDGYLWVATYGGLMRFNGASFSAVQSPGVFKKSIRTMLLGQRETIWLGMDSGAVLCLESNRSRSYGAADGLPMERIAAMTEDRSGAVWVISSTALCRIKDGAVSRFTVAEGLPAGINAWVATDADGQIWFSKGGQLGVIRNGQLQQRISFEETAVRICCGASPGLWLCVGPRLLKYSENHGPVEVAHWTNHIEPQALFEDRSGALWIGTAADGIFTFKNGVLEKVPISHQSVNCISEDREGSIWAGTRGGGLNLIRPSAATLIGRDAGLPFESVASVCQSTDGLIWVVAQNGNLANLNHGHWEVVDSQTGLPGNVATCVAADKNGGVWVGARNRTLNFFRDGVWKTWSRAEGLHNGAVHLIFVAANDDVWVVAGSPSRLQRLRNGIISEPLSLPGVNHTIRAVTEDADGTLWIGTLEGQVLRVKDSSLVVETAAVNPGGEPIRALATTADGALLVGYAGAGIGWLKAGQFSRITEANGLADNFVSQLLTDERGDFWVTGNRGVFRLQADELAAVAVGRAGKLRSLVLGHNEGLPNFQPNSANFPSVCKAADGRLWFALLNGLLTVQPENIRGNPLPPPVVLERVRLDDQPVSLYNSASPLRTDGGKNVSDLHVAAATLQLPPGHRKLELEFAALSFASPENVQFRYQLENFDEKPIEAGRAERSVTYAHLPPGRYRFHVIACNNAGVWNEAGAVLPIEVSPYYWQQWWFRILVLSVFTASVVAVVRYVSFRRLRARMLQLEQQAAVEKERTRIARDMHDEVGAKLTRLSLLTDLAGGNPDMPASAHDDVQEISETARETIRSFEEVVWAVNPRNDTLANLVHYLCRYAEDYFEGSPVRCSFDLPAHVPSAMLPTEVRRQVFLAAKEALNNVLKHSQANRVSVKLSTSVDEFVISIEDDGCGFDRNSPPQSDGGGNGLGNMSERLQSVGGCFECHSENGRGTRITLRAPIQTGAPKS
jgi:signal transduction histidine kinase/ligand-binding sensor domain-containing protein